MDSRWLHVLRTSPEARLRLYCFAASGSGASAFRAWLPHLPAWLELVAVQLPGHEERAREPPLRRLDAIVSELAAVLSDARSPLPSAFFGHSLGGRIAFELARALEQRGGPAPVHVLLAASMEASAMTALDRRCHLLPDADFEAYVAAFGAFPDELRRYPRQFKAVMDLLRADLEVFATDAAPQLPRLRAPLAVLVAREDAAVTGPAVEPWSMRTSGAFSLSWFEQGGHFFPIKCARACVERVAALLGLEPLSIYTTYAVVHEDARWLPLQSPAERAFVTTWLPDRSGARRCCTTWNMGAFHGLTLASPLLVTVGDEGICGEIDRARTHAVIRNEHIALTPAYRTARNARRARDPGVLVRRRLLARAGRLTRVRGGLGAVRGGARAPRARRPSVEVQRTVQSDLGPVERFDLFAIVRDAVVSRV